MPDIETILFWLFTSGLRVGLILFCAYVLVRILKTITYKGFTSLFKKISLSKESVKIEENRLRTLANVIFYAVKTAVWIVAIITALPELGISIAPILAGLGIGGLALGMAARDLIQDYLFGVYILIEDQFRVGEEIEGVNFKGKVRDFTLRRTTIIDEAGNVRFVPNGQIKILTNLSRKS